MSPISAHALVDALANALAAVVHQGFDWPPVPLSEEEAREVAVALPRINGPLDLRSDADRARVRANLRRITRRACMGAA